MAIAWKETTEDRFNDMLGCVPPAARAGGGFLVGEPYDTRDGEYTFRPFCERDGKFFEAEPVTFQEFKAEFPGAENYYRS